MIFKPLGYCFEETIGFHVKASFASRLVSRLIRWYNKPDEITKEFWEKAIQFHGIFQELKITNCKSKKAGSAPACIYTFLRAKSDFVILKIRKFQSVKISNFFYIVYLAYSKRITPWEPNQFVIFKPLSYCFEEIIGLIWTPRLQVVQCRV